MHSRYLYYFKQVSEIQNITRAAEELYVSQSQLSRIISEIENEVGVVLFDRDKHGITLNESGRVFYHYVVKSLVDLDEGMNRAREAHDKGRVHFAIASNVQCYMPELVMRILDEIPQSEVKQISAPRKSLTSMLRNGNVDCVLAAPPLEGPRTKSDVVYTERPTVVYPEGHWLASVDSVGLPDLAEDRHVTISSGYGIRDSLENAFQRYDVPFDKIIVETGDLRSAVEYVSKGVGVAMLPKSFVVRDGYCKDHFVDVAEDVTYDVGLSWNYNHIARAADEQLFEVVLSYFSQRTY